MMICGKSRSGQAGEVNQACQTLRLQDFRATLLDQQHPRPEQIDVSLAAPSFLTLSSNVATRLSVMPKISKKAIQNGLASESSLAASAQCW